MDKINTMSYSPQLVYFLDRMSGFSTNIFKLMPSGSDSSGPNSISRITLPSNALLNTRSFKLHFLASTVAASSVGGYTNCGPQLNDLRRMHELAQGWGRAPARNCNLSLEGK